jgi:O-antigen/teichoic acid export membrane protein
LTLALNLLLIPLWDITGAALATLLAQFFYFAACFYYSQKVFFIPYEIRKILMIFFSGTLLSFSSLFLNHMDLLPRLVIKTGCLLSFPLILYLFSFYEPIELQSIKGFVVKWANIKKFRSNLNSLKGITDDE